MIEISVTGLQKSFDLEKKILDGLTFQINSGERVGLLGKNGAGKTTLFRILTGEIDYDAGEVAIASDRRVGLISQIPVYPAGYTVEDVLQSAFERMRRMADEMERLSAQMAKGDESEETLRRYGELSARFEGLGGYDTATAVNKVSNGLSIPADMRTRLFDTLSGGEKTRVNLGRLILEDTDILLLDEPTNHLDLHAIEWLEEYLASFKGTVVAISHDRYFLDRTITRVIEILDGHAEFYNGNYSFYAVEKERRYLEKMRQYEKEQAKIRQLEAAADKLHLWAFMGNDALHKRAFSMEKRIERMRTTDKPTREKKMTAQFRSSEFLGDEVLTLKGIGKSFGERTLFSGVDLKVAGGERIALIGDNGTGKSTLIKMIMGEEYPDDGPHQARPLDEDRLPAADHSLRPCRSAIWWTRCFMPSGTCTPQKARDRLAAFHFRGEDVFKSVSVALRRRAEPPAAVHADGRRGELPHSRRADQPPRHRLARVDRGGGGGLRRDAAVRQPRPLLHQPLRHPRLGAGGAEDHRLPDGLRPLPQNKGGAVGEKGRAGKGSKGKEPYGKAAARQ